MVCCELDQPFTYPNSRSKDGGADDPGHTASSSAADSALKKEQEEEKELAKEEREQAVSLAKFLDSNRDGFVSRDEWMDGCVECDVFSGLGEGIRCDVIWGGLK